MSNCPLSLTPHEFQIHVSVSILTIKISQWARVNFCSYHKMDHWSQFLFLFSWWFLLCYLTLDEDEEGDRITVRGDEELQAMINGVGLSYVQYWMLSIVRHVIFGSKCTMFVCKKFKNKKRCTFVIGFVYQTNKNVLNRFKINTILLYSYNSTNALIGCWEGKIFL